VAVAATTTGLQASGALSPTQPDLASSTKELSDLNAALTPIRRELESAAQQGGKGSITLPDGTVQTYDFTGVGGVDADEAVARQMAQINLDLQKKYGVDFVEQAREQEKLADPESFAARSKLNEMIQQQIGSTPERPVADLLQGQIGEELSAAKDGHLSAPDKSRLDEAVAAAGSARGGVEAVDFESPLTTGMEGERRKAAAIQKANSWMTSGATPEDVDYRREQTNLANLQAFISGQTPQSQFKSLSGAQAGPAPMATGQPLPQMATNSTQAGAQNAISTAAAQSSQVNPWMAGLSGLIGLGNVAAGAGWKPFKPTG
jgi:hypothetical protein